MIRTQIYLTENEKEILEQLCSSTGRSQSEIIRSALDTYLKEIQLESAAKSAFAIWKDNDLNFATIRSEVDR